MHGMNNAARNYTNAQLNKTNPIYIERIIHKTTALDLVLSADDC